MKAKSKLLATAIALASGSTQAAIDSATSGNGELVFTIWDKVSEVAYTKDLGFNMNDFLAGGANASVSQSFNLAGDANWSSFIGQADEANSVFAVIALDGTGKVTAGGSRYLTTSKASKATIAANQTNANLRYFDITNNFINAQNNKGTHPGSQDGSAFTTKVADGYAYPQSGYNNVDTWYTKTQGFTTSAKVGEANNFYFLTTSSTYALMKASVTQYLGSDLSAATWTVDLATNTLNYNVVETPLPAAAWLLCSALVGLIGVSRRRTTQSDMATSLFGVSS